MKGIRHPFNLCRIPPDILHAYAQREDARAQLEMATKAYQETLKYRLGELFQVEGVPYKVCGKDNYLYLRRMVSKEKARELHEKWRRE